MTRRLCAPCFEGEPPPPGQPQRPSLPPLGRLEIVLPPQARLKNARLETSNGQVAVRAECDGREHEFIFQLAMSAPVLHIQVPPAMARRVLWRRVTAWSYPEVAAHLRSISFREPQLFEGQTLSGRVQTRPAGAPLCVGFRRDERDDGHDVWLGLDYGEDAERARANVEQRLERFRDAGPEHLRAANAAWWGAVRATVRHFRD